ncbi:MAG: SMP-30/gluconolactonase/LRE family protein [Rhizobiaceae bacterium]
MRTVGPACTLGEGPLWHPLRGQLFWFDIPVGRLYACDVDGENLQNWDLGEPASAAGWVDAHTLIVATASGLNKLDIETGKQQLIVGIEADNPITRSNDGRIGPDGSFWIGTMGLQAEPRVGAFYRYTEGGLTKLIDEVSIPNATCFSPDGRAAYLADTMRQIIWRWNLDVNGAPSGEREIHINMRDKNLNPDGAVCDAEGFLWNAQWGASRVARYAPDGRLDRIIELPISQPTCPAFGGKDLKTLFITSAKQGLSAKKLKSELNAGKTFALEIDVPGLREHQAKL